jgi:hypothetical protein
MIGIAEIIILGAMAVATVLFLMIGAGIITTPAKYKAKLSWQSDDSQPRIDAEFMDYNNKRLQKD